MANSRKFSNKNNAAKPVNDPFIYPRGGLYSTRQYLEFWAEQTQQPQDQNDICSQFTAKMVTRNK